MGLEEERLRMWVDLAGQLRELSRLADQLHNRTAEELSWLATRFQRAADRGAWDEEDWISDQELWAREADEAEG